MSVSGELLCSFELLKPLDSTALKNHIKKGRTKRNSMLNSPVSQLPFLSLRQAIPIPCANHRSTYSLQHHLLKVTKLHVYHFAGPVIGVCTCCHCNRCAYSCRLKLTAIFTSAMWKPFHCWSNPRLNTS